MKYLTATIWAFALSFAAYAQDLAETLTSSESDDQSLMATCEQGDIAQCLIETARNTRALVSQNQQIIQQNQEIIDAINASNSVYVHAIQDQRLSPEDANTFCVSHGFSTGTAVITRGRDSANGGGASLISVLCR